MRREVRLGFEAGARMLSFGLVYLPGAYAATDELVAVAEEAARASARRSCRTFATRAHGLLEAVGEMIDVARRSGAPLHVSHLKSLADERLVEPLLELLDERGGRDRRDASTSTPTARAARCSRASCRPGPRRAVPRERSRALGRRRERGAGSPRDIADGLPGWENILGTLGPERIEIANAAAAERGRGRADARRRSRTTRGERPRRRRPST